MLCIIPRTKAAMTTNRWLVVLNFEKFVLVDPRNV